ncbi:hypothetical protein Acr_11g0007300 [Actinidia rufa]|uniref:Uncharacterized protein n=1 Tax=Actinidia rufa TaxID=165716 RepID=A0A7J0FCK1_9ERIC|nr:hypothetical protein Acr_11g0007300 [Actinidia rufa]
MTDCQFLDGDGFGIGPDFDLPGAGNPRGCRFSDFSAHGLGFGPQERAGLAGDGSVDWFLVVVLVGLGGPSWAANGPGLGHHKGQMGSGWKTDQQIC